MTRSRGTTVIMGVCVALAAGAAWAESSPFVGRWHWNQAQSTLPPGEPSPTDVVSEISRADGSSVTWSVTIVTPDGQPHVVTLEAGADGESHRISSDTTASVRLMRWNRSEEHTSELQSRLHLVCRLLLEKKKKKIRKTEIS